MKEERDGDYMVELSKTRWAAHVRAGGEVAKLKLELLRATWDLLRPLTRRITFIKWIDRP